MPLECAAIVLYRLSHSNARQSSSLDSFHWIRFS
jgi:hypothetical protein